MLMAPSIISPGYSVCYFISNGNEMRSLSGYSGHSEYKQGGQSLLGHLEYDCIGERVERCLNET